MFKEAEKLNGNDYLIFFKIQLFEIGKILFQWVREYNSNWVIPSLVEDALLDHRVEISCEFGLELIILLVILRRTRDCTEIVSGIFLLV